MSDSDQSSDKNQIQSPKKSPSKQSPLKSVLSSPPPPKIEDQTSLFEQNRKLRRKLKELSIRLDEQLQKFAEQRLKQQAQKQTPPAHDSKNMELQNAYKIIERLQKSVHDFQSKESYQVTLKRVNDLEAIIKKKDKEIEDLKVQIKTLKKLSKESEKHVEELLEAGKKQKNPAEEREVINRLKNKMKKIVEDNEMLRKKQLQKHEKLVLAQRKIVQLQQSQQPIGKEESLLTQIQQWKTKHKEAMQRVQRQNIYITKLNEKLSKQQIKKKQRKQASQQGMRYASKSVEELGERSEKILHPGQLLDHLPIKQVKLRRY